MTTITIKSFPAAKLETAKNELAKAHARLARAAAKAGQTVGAAPVITVTESRLYTSCTLHCNGADLARELGRTSGECPTRGCEGYLVTRQVCDLDVAVERPALAGWDFLAVVEPLTGGNLIKQVPGADVADGELVPWRTGDIVCDHCETKRRRAETFVVRADGTDPAVEKGTYKQVGRQCLAHFLGGKSPAAIIASLAIEKTLRDIGDSEGGSGGGGPSVYEPVEFMSWVASVVRHKGWTAKSAATDERPSTASRVTYLLNPPWDPRARAEWQKDREEFRPTEADIARGTAALTWAQNLSGASDYERNLNLVAVQPVVQNHHAGILASAISGFMKTLGEKTRRDAAPATSSAYVGKEGEKKRGFGKVTLERVGSFESTFGTCNVHTFRDEAGNAIVWKTGTSPAMEVGNTFTLVANVKRHSEFRGEKQTEVTHCKLESRKVEEAA